MILQEDYRPTKLVVGFSKDITNKIESIYKYNQGNESLGLWSDYLSTILNHISNPSIAFDYKHKSIHFRNGAILLKDFGCDAIYYIKTYNTRPPYVYIFKVNLKTEEYGLKLPPTLNENKKIIPLTESHIRQIVREILRRYLQL